MEESKPDTVTDNGPTLRVRSTDALRPRSGSSRVGIVKRLSPAACVSSVSGVGAKNPVPTDTRALQPLLRNNAETRGLTNVPYTLWTSARPLADTLNQGRTATSS